MGQRLNIEITASDKPLANSYYHWSAYTGSALELAAKIIQAIPLVNESDPVLRAIRLLETTGAKLTPEEAQIAHERMSKQMFELANNRNDGLIAITAGGMNQTRTWEEGRVEIDLDRETINFEVYFLQDENDYREEHDDEGDIDYDDLIQAPKADSLTEISSFTEFLDAKDAVDDVLESGHFEFKKQDGDVVSFIA